MDVLVGSLASRVSNCPMGLINDDFGQPSQLMARAWDTEDRKLPCTIHVEQAVLPSEPVKLIRVVPDFYEKRVLCVPRLHCFQEPVGRCHYLR